MSHTGKSSEYRGVTLFRPTMKWRAQISAGGKTTSLGDHDSEELAAKAFDRAAINKAGTLAKTNFPMDDYKDEVDDLRALSQVELVAMLRSKARKSGTQTSHFRGVSLLKQTNKWHAQINVGGKQVHLGFFSSEELAARAYDRAAINKGAKEGTGKIITNFDIAEYNTELDWLRRISQEELVNVLASEGKRKQAMEMLSTGLVGKVEGVFGKKFPIRPNHQGNKAALEALRLKSERAQPKSTLKNPLYTNFGKKGGDQDKLIAAQAHASAPLMGKAASPKKKTAAKPKKAAALVKDSGTKRPKQLKSPTRTLFDAGELHAQSKPAVPKEPAVLGRGHRSMRPSEKLRDTDADAAGTSRAETTPEPSGTLSTPVPATPKRKRATRPTPASPTSPAAVYGAGPAARYAAFLDPLSPLQPHKKRRSSLDGVAIPPTPQQLAWRRPGEGDGPADDAAAALAGIAASPVQARSSVQTLQDLLRQQRAEHKRQQDERKALVSDVIERFMAPPLTKRQEALAARKQREAVRGQEALFGFAEAAEQAAREDADGPVVSGPATPGAAPQVVGPSGSDTTITQTPSGQKHQTPESEELQLGRTAHRRRKGRPPARAAT